MKQNTLVTAMALASLVSFGAAASTGTVTFNGEITDTTCEVNVNGTGKDTVVTLPTVPNNALEKAGDTAGNVSFIFELSQCSNDTSKKALAFFEAGATVNAITGRLINVESGGAENVELQILDQKNAAVKVGDSSQRAGANVEVSSAGNAQLPYSVQYYATDAAKPGKVSSSVVYTMDYS